MANIHGLLHVLLLHVLLTCFKSTVLTVWNTFDANNKYFNYYSNKLLFITTTTTTTSIYQSIYLSIKCNNSSAIINLDCKQGPEKNIHILIKVKMPPNWNKEISNRQNKNRVLGRFLEPWGDLRSLILL